METLLRVMVDRSSQVFKITTSAAIASTRPRVCAATGAINFGKRLAAPPFGETNYPLIELGLVCLPCSAIFIMYGQHISDIDRLNIFQATGRRIFFSDVSR
ncbi:hypothetical protein [Bradyrhizobium sp. 193]|uniref:hypothetical protein n=1 Tax=Bradyrhizobium sp. 193 TaxID=2782661 RepID=UPI003211BC64